MIRTVNVKDYAMILIITILPLSFYIVKLIPEHILDMNLFGYDFELTNILWYLIIKIYLITLLSLWYFTCKNWWRLAILIPLIIELFKLLSFLNFSNQKFDETDFLTSLPITIPILIVILIISKRLKTYINAIRIYNKINLEIEQVFQELNNISPYSNILNEFHTLRRTKNIISREDYLVRLMKIRKKLIE